MPPKDFFVGGLLFVLVLIVAFGSGLKHAASCAVNLIWLAIIGVIVLMLYFCSGF